ncbi:MAG: hypothetical protein ACPG35_03870 [Candidatus Puniceispirillaceae bacterium]
MDNDLIRQQIESAKKSFVSTKTKQNDKQFQMAGTQPSGSIADLSRLEQQTLIMGRLKSLMDEAAQTPRQESPSYQDIARNTPRETTPFWAQTQRDISPSERFATQQREQESKMADTPPSPTQQPEAQSGQAGAQPDSQQPAPEAVAQSAQPEAAVAEMQPPAQAAMPAKPSNEAALSAIRSEVFSHMEKAPIPAELLERIQQIEQRASQQQQDLTSVLKLVRQLAASQKEFETVSQPKRRGFFSTLLFSMLVLIGMVSVGALGWLYVMNPALVNSVFTQIINSAFIQTIHFVSVVAGAIGINI